MPIDGCQRITDGVLLTGPAIGAVLYAVEVAQRARSRNGLPPSTALAGLRAALAPGGHADGQTESAEQHEAMLECSTETAAAMLRCSPRTARRLAPALGGRLVGGRWVFDSQAVNDHIAGRKP